MQDKIAQEVQDALTATPEEINFEQLQNENSSPLNQPVIEKDIGGERPVETDEEKQKSWNVWKPEQEHKTLDELEPGRSGNTQTDFRTKVEAKVEKEKEQEPLDAPEQEINGNGFDTETDETLTDQDFEVPLAQANQAADAILGMSNNVLAVGGGYFVKIRKHQEFYEFEEIIQVVDQQNEKNVERIKLDKEDQALLRPLLAQVLRKKAKKLTPEQQLMGAVISILMKKAQVVMEVRAENSLLENRILDIVRQEKGESEIEDIEEEDEKEDVSDGTDSAFAKSSVRDSRPQGEQSVKAEVEKVTAARRTNSDLGNIPISNASEPAIDGKMARIEAASETSNAMPQSTYSGDAGYSKSKKRKASKPVISDFHWLLGSWKNPTENGFSYEKWEITGKKSLAANGYLIQGKDTIFIEKMELKQVRNKVFYITNVAVNKTILKFEISPG